MSLKEDIKTLLSQQSGLSSTEMAEVLGKDRNNVRVAARELVRDGELLGQDEGGTFRFYPVGDGQIAGPVSENVGLPSAG